MSSEEKHLGQYKHNKLFLSSGINSKDNFPDWTITVTFYCGVHLVEAMLAKIGLNSISHTERRKHLKDIPNHSSFESEYLDLYNLSRQARYDCITVGKSQMFNAQLDLDAICSAYKKSPSSR